MIDQGVMTLFRVIYDKADWEATNDNSDPDVMNWAYYNLRCTAPRTSRRCGICPRI